VHNVVLVSGGLARLEHMFDSRGRDASGRTGSDLPGSPGGDPSSSPTPRAESPALELTAPPAGPGPGAPGGPGGPGG